MSEDEESVADIEKDIVDAESEQGSEEHVRLPEDNLEPRETSTSQKRPLDEQADSVETVQIKKPRIDLDALKELIKIKTSVAKVSTSKREKLTKSIEEATTGGVKLQLSKNEGGKRLFDKVEYCQYCQLAVTNVSTHFVRKHKSEPEVKKILSLPPFSEERRREILKLRNAGNYKHNLEVLKKGTGLLVTKKRCSTEMLKEDYLPCKWCLGFFVRSSLWKHQSTCAFMEKVSAKRAHIQAEAALLLPLPVEMSQDLKVKVVCNMRKDEVRKTAINDTVIVKVGEELLQQRAHSSHMTLTVGQTMRRLGQFLIAVRKLEPQIESLTDVIKPEKLPVAIDATQMICKFDKVTCKYKNPSLALKLGHDLRKCAKMIKSESQKQGDKDLEDTVDEFLYLWEDIWPKKVSSSALHTIRSGNSNSRKPQVVSTLFDQEQVLQLAEDVLKMHLFLQKKTESLKAALENSFSRTDWDLLNQVTLAQVALINRCPSSFAERITLSGYLARQKNCQKLPDSVKESLSPTEKALIQKIVIAEVRDNSNRIVPLLLPNLLHESIDILLKWRADAGVDSQNMFVFARPGDGHLESICLSRALKKFWKEAGLDSLEHVTKPHMKRHVAMFSHVLDLDQNALELLANTVKHDVVVDDLFSHCPQDAHHVARLGKLLTVFNNGRLEEYKGKSIDDIPLGKQGVL